MEPRSWKETVQKPDSTVSITINDKRHAHTVGDMKIGDWFLLDSILYMKIGETSYFNIRNMQSRGIFKENIVTPVTNVTVTCDIL